MRVKRMKTLNRDQRVHELESMILKRDTKIENLNENSRGDQTRRCRYHDTMQSIQNEASKTSRTSRLPVRAAKSVSRDTR